MRAKPRLSPLEIRRLWTALRPNLEDEAQARMKAGVTLRKFPQGRRSQAGAVRDQIGRMAGVSGRHVEKVVAVYEAYDSDPVLFARALTYLEATENATQALRFVQRARDEVRVLGLRPIRGRFPTLALDPPWRDESISESQRPAYVTMSIDEIRALPVPGWSLDEGHLYVHAPGPFLGIAIELVVAWGYAFKTVLTWQKSQWSMGRYFRTEDEFVVFGTRGDLMTRRQDVSNHFAGPVGEHSEKPEAFYELVRRASFPPYGEGFQRQPRPDFANLFETAPAESLSEAAE